jgi:hypothetical protein
VVSSDDVAKKQERASAPSAAVFFLLYENKE